MVGPVIWEFGWFIHQNGVYLGAVLVRLIDCRLECTL